MNKSQNSTPQPYYRVVMKQSEQVISFAENILEMTMAVKLALNMHEASNTQHVIHVLHDDIIDCTFIRYGSTQQN